jgi:sugar phosphate isomerase/epimerase
MMRIAFSTLAFPDASLATATSLGRGWGYDGVELRLIDGELIDPSMPVADRARVKRTVAEADLPVISVDSSIRLTDADPAPEVLRFLELASDWESPLVRVFGGLLPDGEPGRQERIEAAARVLEACVPAAERLGVSIGVETHDAFSASSLVARLLAMIDSPWVGAVWDSHHPHRAGERPAEVSRNLGDRVLLAQVKDARRTAAPDQEPGQDPGQDRGQHGWQLVLLGEGEVPVREMLGLLASRNYQGWVSVEWEKRWHPEIEEPEVALPQHLELLRKWVAAE